MPYPFSFFQLFILCKYHPHTSSYPPAGKICIFYLFLASILIILIIKYVFIFMNQLIICFQTKKQCVLNLSINRNKLSWSLYYVIVLYLRLFCFNQNTIQNMVLITENIKINKLKLIIRSLLLAKWSPFRFAFHD